MHDTNLHQRTVARKYYIGSLAVFHAVTLGVRHSGGGAATSLRQRGIAFLDLKPSPLGAPSLLAGVVCQSVQYRQHISCGIRQAQAPLDHWAL